MRIAAYCNRCLLFGALSILVGVANEGSASAKVFGACYGCTPTLSPSNGKVQHPEIAITFWEDPSHPAWDNGGTNTPTYSQYIGQTLSLVNNGQYWSKIFQYGTYGGASGMIAPPRLAPYATIYAPQQGVNGHFPVNNGFSKSDIVAVINNQIQAGHLPSPQSNDDSVYVVFVPGNIRLFVERRGEQSSGLTARHGRRNAEGEEAPNAIIGADGIGHHEAQLA